MNAAALELYVCSACSTLSRTAPGKQRCPRCGAALAFRKAQSLARTWALLGAAIILYVPANLLPVMHTEWLTGSQDDTILSGVLYLLWSGSWPLALVVFIASITVPLLKIVTLAGLAASVQLRSTWQPKSRARAYRVVEFIGRWSMLDIYVVAILAALVQAKALAHIEPGPGALAFAAVVVLTMLAAMSFDPRLIWDAQADGSR